MTLLHSPPSLRTRYDSDEPAKAAPQIQRVTEAQRQIDPEIDPAYDKASFTRREKIAGTGLLDAHGMMRHGVRLAAGALGIAAIGLLIGFHAWQDHMTLAAAAGGGDDLVLVETVSDDATTLLLAGTVAKLIGVPRNAVIQRLDAQPAAPASGKAAAANYMMREPAASAQPVWLARTVDSVVALPATLSPSRLIDPITQAVRDRVQQGLQLAGIADEIANVSALIDRFQNTIGRTLPDALERATPRR